MVHEALKYQKFSYFNQSAFTLIELSIVLVIVGLLIGGVLVGQDLINTAAIRSQISQIAKYNTAVRTFQGKYGYLPGDIPAPYATQFGFAARGTQPGQGDGNGIVAGFYSGNSFGSIQCSEPQMLWVDLSMANLIDGGFSTASPTTCPGSDIVGSAVSNYYPKAKLGNFLYIYTLSNYSSNLVFWSNTARPYQDTNFFTISGVLSIGFSSNYGINNGVNGIAVIQAYNMDKKTDDGLPTSGRVLSFASVNTGNLEWANQDGDLQLGFIPGSSGIIPSATTCYDNNNSASKQVQYSISQNNGAGLNCSLSFKFQ